MNTGRLTPLTSYADGLGILPSAESLDHRSVFSLALTGSTCTISSIADPDGNRGRSRSKVTMRTKEIEKSPIPHRFHLVPSGRKRPYQPPSRSPKPAAKWTYRECGDGADTESVYSKSPSLYEMDASPELAQDVVELQRSVIEDLVSDALHSPVFDSFCPTHGDLDGVPSPQASSLTLVNEQSSKSKRFSSMYGSTRESCGPDSVEPSEHIHILEHSPLLESLQSNTAKGDIRNDEDDEDTDDIDDDASHNGDTQNHACHEDDAPADLPITHDSNSATSVEYHHQDLHPSPDKAQPSSSSHTLPDTSLSSYSVHSDRSDLSASRQPLSDSMRSMKSRRATEMSFGSTMDLPSPRDRRFALRRQAIYAEYGFQIAFPESDSDSSLRQGRHSPTRPHKKGHAMGGRAASASAYVFSASASATSGPRTAWSTSTSGASLRSVADLADGSLHPSPLPSCGTLNLAQANDKLERLSVQEDLLASCRIPFTNDPGSFKTSMSPMSSKSTSLRSLTRRSSNRAEPSFSVSTTEVLVPRDAPPVPVSHSHIQPWAPLRIVKRDSTDPLVLCVPVSPSDRAERFVIWREDPGHHPIVDALLSEVRRALEEWKGIGAVVAYF